MLGVLPARPTSLLYLLAILTNNPDALRSPFPRLWCKDHKDELAYGWRKPLPGAQCETGGLGQAEQKAREEPTFLPKLLSPLGALRCGPGVRRQISGISGQILRAKVVSKTWKEIYHCETALKVKSWALRDITNTCHQIIFTVESSSSSDFLLCLYSSLGKGIFLYPTFQISTAESRHYTCWNT